MEYMQCTRQVYRNGQMANARFKSPAELRAVFEEAGVNIDKPLVSTGAERGAQP